MAASSSTKIWTRLNKSNVLYENIFNKNISDSRRDTMWLVSVSRWAVQAVVRWSCYVTTKMCPFDSCQEEEPLEHLLLEGHRSRVWGRMIQMGKNVNINYSSVKSGICQEKLSSQVQELYWRVICTVVVMLWRTRDVEMKKQTFICSKTLVKQPRTDLYKRGHWT